MPSSSPTRAVEPDEEVRGRRGGGVPQIPTAPEVHGAFLTGSSRTTPFSGVRWTCSSCRTDRCCHRRSRGRGLPGQLQQVTVAGGSGGGDGGPRPASSFSPRFHSRDPPLLPAALGVYGPVCGRALHGLPRLPRGGRAIPHPRDSIARRAAVVLRGGPALPVPRGAARQRGHGRRGQGAHQQRPDPPSPSA